MELKGANFRNIMDNDLTPLLKKFYARILRVEISALGLFVFMLYLMSLFGRHMGWNDLKESRILSRNYHAYSNWSTHILANQGILIHPVEYPVFAEFSFALEFELNVENGKPTVEIQSPWKPTKEHNLEKLLPNIRALKTRNSPYVLQYQAWIQREVQEYVYGNLSTELNQRNLQVAIPSQDFDMYSQLSVELIGNDYMNWGVCQKMRLRIPVRRSTPAVQIVRIKVLDFFIEPDWLCSGREAPWINPDFNDPEFLAFVKDQEVRLIYPKRVYLDASHYMICDSFICEVTKEEQEKYLINYHPCLSAIQRDASVQEVEDVCKIPCFHTPKSTLKPAVIELGDKLYISRITHLISIHCLNSSHNQILEVPPTGALEMRIRCGCNLFHESDLLWSRHNSQPPTCVSADSLKLEVFQLAASAQVRLGEKQEMFHKIPISSLEQKVFFNFSGHILTKEVIDQILEEKLHLPWYCQLIVIPLVVFFYWGLYQLFYKVCVPPWYRLLDWLEVEERCRRSLTDIVDDWVECLENHAAAIANDEAV